MKNKQKTKSPVGKSVLTLLCIGLAASLASIASVQAVIIDDFQSYTAGSNLLGQGPLAFDVSRRHRGGNHG